MNKTLSPMDRSLGTTFQSSVKFTRRKIYLVLGGLISISLVTIGFLYYIGIFTSNFRTVQDKRLYRSAQLQPDALQNTFERYGIRTVLNLRGESRKGEWFKNERSVCDDRDVNFHSIELDNDELPHPDELKKLVERLEQGPFPMLVHCRKGADRTGLASVLFMVIVEARPLEEATRFQMTWHQGHMPIIPDSNDRLLMHYRRTAAGLSLRDWIFNAYPALFEKLGPKG